MLTSYDGLGDTGRKTGYRYTMRLSSVEAGFSRQV
jgi:hypothetical protein